MVVMHQLSRQVALVRVGNTRHVESQLGAERVQVQAESVQHPRVEIGVTVLEYNSCPDIISAVMGGENLGGYMVDVYVFGQVSLEFGVYEIGNERQGGLGNCHGWSLM